MPDIADRADSEVVHLVAEQVRMAQKSETKYLPIGSCYYCNEDVDSRQLFCDADCATDHSKMMKQLLATGRQ